MQAKERENRRKWTQINRGTDRIERHVRLEVVLCVQSAMANSDGTELLHGQNVHRVVSEEEGETDKEHQEEEEEEEKKPGQKESFVP